MLYLHLTSCAVQLPNVCHCGLMLYLHLTSCAVQLPPQLLREFCRAQACELWAEASQCLSAGRRGHSFQASGPRPLGCAVWAQSPAEAQGSIASRTFLGLLRGAWGLVRGRHGIAWPPSD